MAETTIQKQEAHELEGVERTRTRRLYIPRVDIFETGEAVVLLADMPGVSEEDVDVTLEKNVLTITGYVQASEREGYSLAYSEYSEGDYERTFVLSDEVDRSRIEATMKDGVLKLLLPKSEALKTRKIEVHSAS
jgi:HSP20 family molecular chaperone IbpA